MEENKYKLTIFSQYGDTIFCFEFLKSNLEYRENSFLLFWDKDNKNRQLVLGNNHTLFIEEL